MATPANDGSVALILLAGVIAQLTQCGLIDLDLLEASACSAAIDAMTEKSRMNADMAIAMVGAIRARVSRPN